MKIVQLLEIVSILLGSGCGKDIDANDFVLRANLAKLNGYMDDVGQRTSMMMINVGTVRKLHNVLTNHSTTGSKERADMLQYLQSIQSVMLLYAKETGRDTAKGLQQIATVLEEESIPVQFAFNLAFAIGPTKRRWQTNAYPSSGLIMLTVAETFCKNITLYGFYPYNKDSLGAPILHHSYQPNLTEFHTKAHNFDEEHRLLKNVSKKGFFGLVLKPCTP
ncbi:Alpha-2,8-sialyltransferase 8B [Holothuria leucospilota]|uniref:Alpha-2,8-sialyltransferase 8B n=1 Tax=Holothuria leucospilota TaxID=206669 RepID=A0A9Q1CP35_HOLLE|nr:Alpha-2,8-sialyltransferase 8B [Holothuria leucospilota]